MECALRYVTHMKLMPTRKQVDMGVNPNFPEHFCLHCRKGETFTPHKVLCNLIRPRHPPQSNNIKAATGKFCEKQSAIETPATD